MKPFILLLCLSKAAFALTTDQSFTPLSIRIPIVGVYIEGLDGDGNRIVGTFRDCAGSDVCKVDIANEESLESVFTNANSIPVGTYNKLTVQTCKTEGIYKADVMGEVEISGHTYYTSSTSGPLSENSSDLSYVTLTYHGCQRDYSLPRPLVVEKDTTVDLSLFFPLTNVAWASVGGSGIPEGCVWNSAGDKSLCMGYPDAVPYLGRTEPKLETYAISEPPNATDTAAGLILLIFDANDDLLGGTTRRYYSPTSSGGHTNYDTPLWVYVKSNNGTYHLENYGSTATTSYAVFPSFRREDHVGKYISNNYNGQEFDYEATLLK